MYPEVARGAPNAAPMALLASLVAGCPVAAPSTECATHLDCPEGYLCHPAYGFCVWDSYRAALADAGRDATLVVGDASQDALGTGDAGRGEDVASPLLVGVHVSCDTEQVMPGQQGLAVSLGLRNLSGVRLSLEQVGLRMFLEQRDVTAQYAAEPLASNPPDIAPVSATTLRFLVEVREEAEAGLVRLDARALARAPDGRSAVVEGVDRPDSWLVAWGAPLWVTVAGDEDDTAGVATVEAAGGPEDLSLREALIVAGAAAQPQHIRFDPLAFPADLSRTLIIDPALGPLPAITAPGTVIDGSGARVELSGNFDSALAGPGLEVLADDVSLKNISMSKFEGTQGSCLRATGVRGLRLVGCSFTDCSQYVGPAAVILSQAEEPVVQGCTFQSNSGYGLSIAATVSGARILDSRFSENWLGGLLVSGQGHLIQGSTFATNNMSGVIIREASGLMVLDSEFINNGRGAGGRPHSGIVVEGSSAGILIRGNMSQDNSLYGVEILAGTSQVRVSQGRFEGDRGGPLSLADGANDGVPAPLIDSFVGNVLSGAAALPAGTVEIYAAEAGYRYLASAEVEGGTWQVALDTPGPVAATLTSVEGSTGPFSAPFEPEVPLVVRTADDELDFGPELRSLEQAGGAADLSLREAITIANNRPGADALTFDPAVFPAGGETVIAVGDGPAGRVPLPAITDDLTTVDGSGAGAVIDGGGHLWVEGLLVVAANDVALIGLSLRGCNANTDGACVVQRPSANRMAVRGCHIACGSASSHGVSLGKAGEVSGCHISACQAGVHSFAASNAVIRDCDIGHNSGSGIALTVCTACTVADNRVHDNATNGIMVSNSVGVLVIGNRVWSSGRAGVAFGGDFTHGAAQFFFNSLADNQIGFSYTHADAVAEFRCNLLAGNAENGIAGSLEGLEESHNLFFDNGGDGATGASAVQGWAAEALDPTDVLADPQLADVATGDMTPGDAVVDRGLDMGYDRNGDGDGLFDGAAPDIGAVEVR